MRCTLILVVGFLLLGCSIEPVTIVDVDARNVVVLYDATNPLSDAGVAQPDTSDAQVSTRVDTLAPDAASTPPDAFAVVDARTPIDSPTQPDAYILPDSPTLPPDSPRDRCAADIFEANDTPSQATPAASGTGWAPTDYAMTWHPGDVTDWVSADLDSTGVVGLFRVHASDVGSSGGMVEVRVTCRDGLATCRGVGTSSNGSTCTGRRVGNAYADVGCVGAAPPHVSILIGVERGAGECEHTLTVSLAPASF